MSSNKKLSRPSKLNLFKFLSSLSTLSQRSIIFLGIVLFICISISIYTGVLYIKATSQLTNESEAVQQLSSITNNLSHIEESLVQLNELQYFDVLLEEAIHYHQNQDYSSSIQMYEKLLSTLPLLPEHQSKYLKQIQKTSKHKLLLSDYIEIIPTVIRYNLAQATYQLYLTQEVNDNTTDFQKSSPNSPKPKANSGHLAKAIYYYTQIQNIPPNNSTHSPLLSAMSRSNMLEIRIRHKLSTYKIEKSNWKNFKYFIAQSIWLRHAAGISFLLLCIFSLIVYIRYFIQMKKVKKRYHKSKENLNSFVTSLDDRLTTNNTDDKNQNHRKSINHRITNMIKIGFFLVLSIYTFSVLLMISSSSFAESTYLKSKTLLSDSLLFILGLNEEKNRNILSTLPNKIAVVYQKTIVKQTPQTKGRPLFSLVEGEVVGVYSYDNKLDNQIENPSGQWLKIIITSGASGWVEKKNILLVQSYQN